MNDAARTLATLRQRVSEVLKAQGLDLWQVAFLPEPDGRLGFHLFAGLADDETATPDDGFDEVIASARRAEDEQRTQASIAELQQRLRRDGGFLDFEP